MTTATKKTTQRRPAPKQMPPGLEAPAKPADCGLVLFDKDKGLPPGLRKDDPVRGHLIGGTVQFREWDNGPGKVTDVDLDDVHFTQFCQQLHEGFRTYEGLMALQTIIEALVDRSAECDVDPTFSDLLGLRYVVQTLVENVE